MRISIATLAIIGLCCLTAVRCDLAQYTVYKSFSDAWYECGEYLEVSNCSLDNYAENGFPSQDIVKQLIRCTLINLSAWNTTTGVRENVLRNSFQPTAGDTCFANRTKECIRNALQHVDCNDDNSKAYETFQCYYRQYGNIANNAHFNPYEKDELFQLTLSSLKIVNPPRCALVQYRNGNILDEPNFPLLLLTWLVRGGFYSLQNGIYLDQLYTQFGNPELLSAQTQQCVVTSLKEVCDASNAVKAHRIFKNCLKDITSILQWVQDVAATLVCDDKPCGQCNDCRYSQIYSSQSPAYNRFFQY